MIPWSINQYGESGEIFSVLVLVNVDFVFTRMN